MCFRGNEVLKSQLGSLESSHSFINNNMADDDETMDRLKALYADDVMTACASREAGEMIMNAIQSNDEVALAQATALFRSIDRARFKVVEKSIESLP